MRLIVAVLASLVLAGCTEAGWDHSFAFLDAQKAPKPVPARSVDAAPQPDEAWCREAAEAARKEAAEHGFDTASQAHRAEAIYAQCQRTPG